MVRDSNYPLNRIKVETSLLRINELRTHFFTDMGVVKAVDGVSFSVKNEDTLGVLGE